MVEASIGSISAFLWGLDEVLLLCIIAKWWIQEKQGGFLISQEYIFLYFWVQTFRYRSLILVLFHVVIVIAL